MSAKPPRYTIGIAHYPDGWMWTIESPHARIVDSIQLYGSKRSAQAAARRLLAAIKAGDVDETEIT